MARRSVLWRCRRGVAYRIVGVVWRIVAQLTCEE